MQVDKKRDFSADGLIRFVKEELNLVVDHRASEVGICLGDALQSAYAMFVLKSPSLLAFDTEMDANPNLKTIFKIERVPSDTQLRVILDNVKPSSLRKPFSKLFSKLQRAELLEKYQVLNGHYALSSDGTGYFSSKTVHCENCMQKKSGSEITYYHQMYGVSLVHPDNKVVIPLMPEPIMNQDGNSKNDCELNASKRFWNDFRREHPHLKAIAVEDSLYSKAPHIRMLNELNIRYIIGAKESDHKYLFLQALNERTQKKDINFVLEKNGKKHYFSAINNLELNESNPDVKVNFLEYFEVDDKKKKEIHFTWVTDIPLSEDNVYEVMRIARARWKIENETFNTLKNQGYHFEHNFGHGNNNLSTIFAILMMLAFLTDQIQQLAYPLFQEALRVAKRKVYFWNRIQARFDMVNLKSMEDLYQLIISKHKFEMEELTTNSS